MRRLFQQEKSLYLQPFLEIGFVIRFALNFAVVSSRRLFNFFLPNVRIISKLLIMRDMSLFELFNNPSLKLSTKFITEEPLPMSLSEGEGKNLETSSPLGRAAVRFFPFPQYLIASSCNLIPVTLNLLTFSYWSYQNRSKNIKCFINKLFSCVQVPFLFVF